MEKLIAIIITFIFIFKGIGHSAPDTIYRKANLRAPLIFDRARQKVINATKRMSLCLQYRSSRKATEAAEFGKQIAKEFPEAVDLKFWTTLVAVLTQAGRDLDAIKLGEKLLHEQFHGDKVLIGVLMHAYLQGGRPKETIRLGEGLFWRERTTKVRIGIALMHAYINDRQPRKAIKLGQEIIKKHPRDVRVLRALGEAVIRAHEQEIKSRVQDPHLLDTDL